MTSRPKRRRRGAGISPQAEGKARGGADAALKRGRSRVGGIAVCVTPEERRTATFTAVPYEKMKKERKRGAGQIG